MMRGKHWGESIVTREKRVLLISGISLLRQTFALLLERWTGLRTVQADSPARARGMLADLNGELALVVVNVDTCDKGLIEHVRGLGVPVLAFGGEASSGPLAKALDSGADDAISLSAPVSRLIDRAAQLAFQATGIRRQASGIGPDGPPC